MSEDAKVVLFCVTAVVALGLAGMALHAWTSAHQPRVEIGAQLRCEVVR